MKPEEKNIADAFAQARRLTDFEMEEIGVRVLQRLRTPDECAEVASPPLSPRRRQVWRWAAAAGFVAAMAVAAVMAQHWIASFPVLAEAADSGLERLAVGAGIRAEQLVSTSTGTVLKLMDGSRVEMRAHTELSLQRATDGVRIRLEKGGVIVNAARQINGHLYVQTKDVMVSVVGTVFLVNAEEAGSRVAVIEGEVRVEHGATTKELRPGEEVATNPSLAVPVRDALSWSRNAGSHLALLQESTVAQRSSASPASSARFAVVSIRPVGSRAAGPATLGPETESMGFGCHGVDGIPRALFRAGPEIPIPQGRCVGRGINFMYLMNYAFGTPWRFGAGIPEWARDDLDSDTLFKIEAAADNPDTATTAQLRAMLQTMLADRFKLQLHRETQTVQAYVFHVAKNGLKIQEASGDIDPPHRVTEGGIKGKTSLDDLARYLTDFVVAFANLGNIDTPFLNRTGLTGVYDYTFRLRPAGGRGIRGGDPNAGPPSRESRLPDLASDMSITMEEQLGLRLDVEKLPVEIIVVDHVEKPSEN